MSRLRGAAPLIAGTLGAGVWAALRVLPSWAGRDAPWTLVGAVLGNPAFWLGALAFAALGGAAWLGSGPSRRRLRPLLAGPGLVIAALLLDPFAHRSTAGALAAFGIGLGAIEAWRRGEDGAPARSRRVRAARIVAAAMVAVVVAGAVGPWGPLNGDEPHYATMSRSLVRDLDLDLAGDYAPDRRDPWVPAAATPHVVGGATPGTAYSFHGYGLAFLLAPAAAIAGLLPAAAAVPWWRAFAALWGAAAILVLYGLLRLRVDPVPAALGAGLMGLTAPLSLQAPHLFPDLPALVLSAVAWWLLAGDRRRVVGAGFALAALPWLHFKFLALFVVQLAASMLPGGRRLPRGDAVRLVALALLGPITLAWANLGLFGNASPLAAAAFKEIDGRRLTLLDHLADPGGALRTGLGLLLDQKDGLLFYAPHYLLAVIGAVWLWRRSRRETLALLAMFLAIWAPAALSQNTGLWSPPARWLVGGLWPIALLAGLGAVAPWRHPELRSFRAVLVTLGVAATAVQAAAGAIWYVGRIDTRAPLLAAVGGPDLELWRLFPLWTRYEEPAWPATLAWTLGVLGLAAWMARRAAADPAVDSPEGREARPGPASAPDVEPARTPALPGAVRAGAARAAGLALALTAGLWLISVALVPVDDATATTSREYDGVRVEVSRLRYAGAWLHSGSVWFAGARSGAVTVSAPEPIERLDLRVHAPVPMDAEVRLGSAVARLDLAGGATRRIVLDPGRGTNWAGRWYWPLEVVSGAAAPASEIFGPADERMLGVVVSFAPVGRDVDEGPD